MIRCLVGTSEWGGTRLALSASETHYLLDVLRVEPGQDVRIFDGRGREAAARFTGLCEGVAVLELGGIRQAAVPPTRFLLAPALIREQRMDWLIEKTTELGVFRICPLCAERCVVRLAAEQRPARRERWERIALGAARQCRTPWAPVIDLPRDVAAFLKDRAALGGPVLMATIEGATTPLSAVLPALVASRPPTVTVMIGPEGDFTPAEAGTAREAGVTLVGLGERVLRAETAAVHVASVLQYEWERTSNIEQ